MARERTTAEQDVRDEPEDPRDAAASRGLRQVTLSKSGMNGPALVC